MEDINSRYRRILAKQLAMNPETWSTLQSHGVNEQSLLRLEFSYHAPDGIQAEALKLVLADQTDYDLRIENSDGVGVPSCAVIGATQPTAISLEILDQWVDWMVTAGLHQDCEFDGWGTQL